MNEALQAAMLVANPEFLPDLEAATFDEVLALPLFSLAGLSDVRLEHVQ